MLTQKSTRALAVAPQVLRFSSVATDLPGRDALLTHLNEQAATRPVPIRHPSDVLLGQQGQLRGDFRMTVLAMQQLCKLLAPGLFQLVANVSGLHMTDASKEMPETSVELVVDLINQLVRLRFDQIQGKGLIINEHASLVEGIVGSRYGFFSHLDFFDKAHAAAKTSSPRGVFHEAILAGRRLAIRFRDHCPWFTHPDAQHDVFYGGSHFVNSEVGNCSVRTAHLVLRIIGDTKALSPYTASDRLSHLKGSRFHWKLEKLLAGTRAKAPPIANLTSQMRRLGGAVLWAGGPYGGHPERYNYLSRQLARCGLAPGFTKRVLGNMLTHGSYREGSVPSGTLKTPGARTAFDLYNALGVSAKRERLGLQEEVEQLAYKLMSGRVSLNSLTGELSHGQD